MPVSNKKLEDCSGCLFSKRTPDDVAKRRYPTDLDEDRFALEFGHDFAVDAFQKIAPSKAFRRLGFKTQVLTEATNAHVRNRLIHTYEVLNVSTVIARILGLNEDLCCAVALGHDIGHAPFGHLGEDFISHISGNKFRHEIFGVIIAQHIERQNKGLNLTNQVLQGILHHSRGSHDLIRTENVSEEANVVMCADKIAYVCADVGDIFERTKILEYDDFPQIEKLALACGNNHRERVAFCVEGLCHESAEKGCVSFQDSQAAKIFFELKDNMYKVYRLVNLQNSEEILEKVYRFLSGTEMINGADPAVVLALMTDKDVLALYGKKTINIKDFREYSVAELIPHLRGKNIDFINPDLDW